MASDTIPERRRELFFCLDICDLIFITLTLFAFALRLYYFFLTKDQPLWWDEAEYMLKAKALAYGTPETGWYTARPVLLPILAAALFKLGAGETVIRLLWLGLSTAALFFVYRIGALLFNKRVGLYAVALGSAFYIDLFYSMRLLVDVPQVFFVTLAAFLLVRAVYDDKAAYSGYAVLPVLALGTAMRFTVALFFVVAALFLIVVKRGRAIRDKRWLVSLGLGIVVFLPFLIFYWANYGNPFFPFLSQGVVKTAPRGGGVLLDYIYFFPNYTNVVVTLVFVAGLVLAVATVIRRRDLSHDRTAQGYVLLLLWTIVPFLFFGFFVDHFEDRYIAMIFPAVFLLTGAALDLGYQYVKKFSPAAAAVAMIVFLIYAAGSMAAHSHAVITERVNSFAAVRDAGLWIKTRSRPQDIVATSSVPQNTYYSERASYAIPSSADAFERLLPERRPNFLLLSIWEASPKWAYDWPERHPDRAAVAAVFFLDQAQKQPAAVVYSLRTD
jgi:4-amino-4-deoxy-L-arabinose transferase-like glycosyltransferase